MAGKTYAVIGSNCFTGAHIVDGLLEDPSDRVVGISRAPEYKPLYLPYKARRAPKFEFKRFDLVTGFDALAAYLDELRPQVVVNVAALSEVGLSNESPVEYFETNTLAVVKLADRLRRRSWLERYVHISSAEIFGTTTGDVDESVLFNPSTPYAVSKAAADQYLNTLIKNFRFPATLIRSTNVFGRHQQLFKIIPRAVIRLKRGEIIELHGGGTSAKSFIHVRDVVAGLRLSLAKGGPGTYHFTVKSERTVAQVVETVCRLMGKDPAKHTKVVGERLGQDAAYFLDCAKAKRELGWAPKVSFDDGVQETIDWIERDWDEVQREPMNYQHRVSRPETEAARA